jgi:bifunctional DNase/RNase
VMLEVGGRPIEVDSRPSDALALAVRTGARIFAAEAVLDRAGVVPDHSPTEDAGGPIDESRLSVFRDFVNSLDMEPGTEDRREGPPRE